MKIISWNVNGLRAVYKRNFLEWFRQINADIVCLQEIKVQKESLPKDFRTLNNYYCNYNFAQKKGYGGVAIFSKIKPVFSEKKIGYKKFDTEGRFIKLRFDNFSLVNFYLPHGGRQKENLNYKLKVYEKLASYLKKSKKIILAGDFNIAHREIDLARPKQNKIIKALPKLDRKAKKVAPSISFSE